MWHSRLGGEAVRTVTGEESHAWNEGHPGPKGSVDSVGGGRLPDAHILRSDITLDLKI